MPSAGRLHSGPLHLRDDPSVPQELRIDACVVLDGFVVLSLGLGLRLSKLTNEGGPTGQATIYLYGASVVQSVITSSRRLFAYICFCPR